MPWSLVYYEDSITLQKVQFHIFFAYTGMTNSNRGDKYDKEDINHMSDSSNK